MTECRSHAVNLIVASDTCRISAKQQERALALISIDQLSLGMTLSQDVRDINSRLLLSKGLQIEAKHIRILKMWGIYEIQVEGVEPSGQEEHPAAASEHLEAVGQNILKTFAELDMDHPAIKEIVKLAILYRVKNMGRETRAAAPPAQASAPRTIASKDILAGLERIEVKLPEVPAVVFELNEIIADPLSSATDIARLVNQSPSLAALLLKIVNSAFYGFRSKIDSISRAVVLIGSKEVSNIALAITIMEAFKDIPRQVLDVATFLEHNLACGIVARILAAHGNIAPTEQLFVAGMLHDIGRLVLCRYFPRVAGPLLAGARASGETLLKTERALIGCTHAQIGSRLTQKWKLPYALENNIQYHHNPCASPNPESAAVVQMADIIVHGLGIGASGEHKAPGFDAGAWARINLPASALPAVIQQAVHQIENFRNFFSGD
jgi:HD-like signal output (HDOD) protein